MEEYNKHPKHGTKEVPPLNGQLPPKGTGCCKIGRMSKAYKLSGIDEELERRYEGDDATLHGLANYIDNRITAATLDVIDNPTELEPATVRAALNGEDSVSATKRDDIQAELIGRIDSEILIDSYVSHETVRRHLNEHLDVVTSRGGFDTFDELEQALESYQDQYNNGVESALKRAASKGIIDGKRYRVFSTRVECEICSEVYRLDELLNNEGCNCHSD
jgi:hypothetical protein